MGDDAETVMQSHDELESRESGTNIDMQEYEKLLRSHIHTLIAARKKKKAKAMKEPENGLILVSQQEIDEEILKNPRNKEEEYGSLKIRQIYRKVYDRRLKLKSKDKTDKEPVVVTDEEMQKEIEMRLVKVNLDVRKIKASRQKNNFKSPQNDGKVPSTPGRKVPSTPRHSLKSLLNTPRSEQKSTKSQLIIDEGERKKVYHK